MYITLNLSELDLKFQLIDIAVDCDPHYTVGELTSVIKEGLEKITARKLPKVVLHKEGCMIDPLKELYETKLSQWDELMVRKEV